MLQIICYNEAIFIAKSEHGLFFFQWLFFKDFINLYERERAWWGGQREKQTLYCRSSMGDMAWAVGSPLTKWATQAPKAYFLKPLYRGMIDVLEAMHI